jgi:hypothetical protein
LMYLLAILDKSMYSERDVEVSLKLAVLTSVPSFDVLDHGGARLVGHSEVPVLRP